MIHGATTIDLSLSLHLYYVVFNIQSLGLERDLTLIGKSMRTLLAMMMAYSHCKSNLAISIDTQSLSWQNLFIYDARRITIHTQLLKKRITLNLSLFKVSTLHFSSPLLLLKFELFADCWRYHLMTILFIAGLLAMQLELSLCIVSQSLVLFSIEGLIMLVRCWLTQLCTLVVVPLGVYGR